MAEHLHLVPQNDLIAHRVDEDGECVCGPRTEFVDGKNVTGWLVVHASLDGREKGEQLDTRALLELRINEAITRAAGLICEHLVAPDSRAAACEEIAPLIAETAHHAVDEILKES